MRVEFKQSKFEGINVLADSIRLKQVFLNLLTNAIKYNHDGGKVEVVCDASIDGFLRLGIKDTGVGISADKLKELFQPFNRLGAEFSGVEGSGIGLVITRQLVNLMKGELEIDSKLEEGSVFWVTMALAPASGSAGEIQETTVTATVKPHSNAGELRILVAEDNLINQELMAAQLKMLGYRADYVENGIEALESWQQDEYQLLLTDIRMPEMDGYELVTQIRLREKGQAQHLPIIAITANALEADVEKCFEAGVDDVIAKPVELDDLRDALEKWAPDQPLGKDSSAMQVDVVDLSTREAIDSNALSSWNMPEPPGEDKNPVMWLPGHSYIQELC